MGTTPLDRMRYLITACLLCLSCGLSYGQTRLLEALANGDVARSRQLVLAGESPNALLPDYRSPMHLAAALGDTSLLRLLLAHGGQLHTLAGAGYDPVDKCDDAVAKEMLSEWERRVAELHAVVAAGDVAGLQGMDLGGGLLLQGNRLREWPLLVAVRQGDTAMVRALAARGARLDWRGMGSPREPHALLYMAALRGDVAMVKVLVELGEPVNARYQGDEPLLNIVMGLGRVEVAAYLLEAGADPNVLVRGELPLYAMACGLGDKALVALLEAKGALVPVSGPGMARLLAGMAQMGDVSWFKRKCRLWKLDPGWGK